MSHKVLKIDEGKSYQWKNDHIFVKVSGADTNGKYDLLLDNFKETFHLPMHMHKEHAETFTILDGVGEFIVGGEKITATKGTIVHVPPGTPHELLTPQTCVATMVFEPAGFGDYLEDFAKLSPEELADPKITSAIDKKHDHIKVV
jgi:quercetin dioxygenase-like cupin family protein